MSDNNHEKVLQDLKAFITNTKILVEKVMKMRIECKESQMTMLRLYNPKIIKILDISHELVPKEVGKTNKIKKIKVKRVGIKKNQSVHFENMDVENVIN